MAAKTRKEAKQIYCGPSLPGLNQFTILNGRPKHLELHIQECSAIEKLIVDIDQLNPTRMKLCVKGSYEERNYYEVVNYLKGVRN